RKQHSRLGDWNRPQHPGNSIPDGLTSTSGIVQTIESSSGFLLFGHHPAYTTIYDALPSYAQTRSTRIVAAKVYRAFISTPRNPAIPCGWGGQQRKNTGCRARRAAADCPWRDDQKI